MAIVAKTYRGDTEDLLHHGRIAVADAEGRLLYSWGEHDKITFARSAAKPIQALAVWESGALERYGITRAELAVICASHNGEPFHVEAVESMLRKGGLTASHLLCGPAYPIAPYARNERVLRGLPPDPLRCDCSGKHTGMLLTAQRYGESLETYLQPHSEVQKRIDRIIEDVCAFPREAMAMAVDDCGVPVHGMPFYKWAQGYARLSRPGLFSAERRAAVEAVTDAMTSHPEMVAGEGRLCTGLMTAFGDRLFGKSGAASFYGIGLKGRGIGIAVKIEDGCSEFVPPVVMKALADLGVVRPDELEATAWLDPNIYNHSRRVVGRKEICFELIKHP